MPSKEKFYSSLTDRKITGKEYQHVLNVWNEFQIKTVKDYLNLYLNCDIVILAGVFEKCRNNNLKSYGLCLSHYVSAPGLSFNAQNDNN